MGAAQVSWPAWQRVVAEAEVAARTSIRPARERQGKVTPAVQSTFRAGPIPVVVAERAQREVRALAEPRAATVALAQQVLSVERLHIMEAAGAVVLVLLGPVDLAGVVPAHRQPETPAQQIRGEVVAGAVPHPVRTGRVARVGQESPSSTMRDRNGRRVERSPVLAAERFTPSPAAAL